MPARWRQVHTFLTAKPGKSTQLKSNNYFKKKKHPKESVSLNSISKQLLVDLEERQEVKGVTLQVSRFIKLILLELLIRTKTAGKFLIFSMENLFLLHS